MVSKFKQSSLNINIRTWINIRWKRHSTWNVLFYNTLFLIMSGIRIAILRQESKWILQKLCISEFKSHRWISTANLFNSQKSIFLDWPIEIKGHAVILTLKIETIFKVIVSRVISERLSNRYCQTWFTCIIYESSILFYI